MLHSTNFKPFIYPQKQFNPSFKGDKDIVIIDDDPMELFCTKCFIQDAIGNNYIIHEALGGAEGLATVDQFKPKLTITAFHMPECKGADEEALITALNKLKTNVIVNSSKWHGDEIKSLKKGVETCEYKCGAKKFVPGFEDKSTLINSAKAILNNEEPPRYDFQKDPLTELCKKIKNSTQKLKNLIGNKNKT